MIRIGLLNVRGLRHKVGDVRDTLNAEKLDILFLTETMLSSEVADGEIHVADYCLVRKDRNNHGGGIAIYFQDSLSVAHLKSTSGSVLLDQDVGVSGVETLFVALQGKRKRTVLGCVYRPPSAPVASWTDLSNQLEAAFASLNRPGIETQLVLTGDFNVDTLDDSHPHLRHYKHFLASYNLSNHVHSPTRFGKTKQSCLDLVLTDDESLINSCTPVPSSVETDHELVVTELYVEQRVSPPFPTQRRHGLKNINIAAFCDALRGENLDSFSNTSCVDLMWLEWTTKFNTVLNTQAPLKPPNNSRPQNQHPRSRRDHSPWMTPELKSLLRCKSTAHRQLIKDPGNTFLREKFVLLRRRATQLSRSLKNHYFTEACSTYSRSPKKLWGLINSLTGRVKSHPPPRASLDSLSNTFSAVVTDVRRPEHLDLPALEGSLNETTLPECLSAFSPVSVGTVLKHLESIDPRKATGSDGIPGLLLKKCAAVIAPSLTAIFNVSLTTGELPRAFKVANIAPVYKSGDREEAGNYRPISLLPIVSKVLEKIVSAQLKQFIQRNNLLPETQFAYRANHSTEDALTYAVNQLLLARDQGKVTGLVFVDLSKAFDRVEHQALIDLLSTIGISGAALKWFADYLSNRYQRVSLGDRSSPESLCSRGVPQGSVLGPLLFTLYIRSLPGSVSVPCILFADDILLFCSGFHACEIARCLSDSTASLHAWLTQRGLQMNVNKTQAMFILPRGSNRSTTIDINITCGSRLLEIVSYYKYLGVILDENLTWEHHLLHITKKVSQKIGALARASQQLTINAKRTFYLSVLASDIEYGSNAFYSSLSTAFKEKLVQLSKRGVRAIFKAPPWTPSAPLYEQLNITTPLKRFEYKLIYFTYRCTHSLASTLLVNQYIILSQSKARTSSITRGQSSVKLALCKVKTRSGSVSPLFTSSLLWNSLPSDLRQPDLSSSQFSHLLYLYLGFPVNRHF